MLNVFPLSWFPRNINCKLLLCYNNEPMRLNRYADLLRSNCFQVQETAKVRAGRHRPDWHKRRQLTLRRYLFAFPSRDTEICISSCHSQKVWKPIRTSGCVAPVNTYVVYWLVKLSQAFLFFINHCVFLLARNICDKDKTDQVWLRYSYSRM